MSAHKRFLQVLEEQLLIGCLDCTTPQPLQGDAEYWRLVRARFLARHWELKLDPASSESIEFAQFLLEQARSEETEFSIEAARRVCVERQKEIDRYLKACRDLTAEEYPAPRVIRLLNRLKLTDEELDVLHYLVLLHSDTRFAGYQHRRHETGQIALFLGFSGSRSLGVFCKSSILVKEDVIRLDSGLFGSLQSQDVLIDPPIVRALSGAPLDAEDLMVLHKTVIEDLIREEPDGEAMLQRVHATANDPAAGSDKDRSATETNNVPGSDPDFTESAGLQDGLAPSEGNDAALQDLSAGDVVSPDGPFRSELDYLGAHTDWFLARLHWKKLVLEGPSGLHSLEDKKSFTARIREARARERFTRATLDRRLKVTLEDSSFVPRGEQLQNNRSLDDFEKHVLLFAAAAAVSAEFREKLEKRRRDLDVRELLFLLCDSLEQQIQARRYFYRDATLLREGLIGLTSLPFGTDLLDMDVELDRRMVDYLLGIETESVSLVEGSHLYTPKVALEQVVLPEAQKRAIIDSVSHFPEFLAERRRSGLDDVISYGGGMVLLFHGESGTGKTMLANAIAAHLEKKVLLVNFPTIGNMTSDQSLRFLIREAKLNDAVLFFDECDGIFHKREGNPGISLLLTELERHEELVILATNRPFELDEAMERRISQMVEFKMPDARQREKIWLTHLPPGLRLSETPDIGALAYKYELTGGLIKNAVLSAVSLATARDPGQPVVSPEDLEQGARSQVRGRLRVSNLEDQFVPRVGLDDLVVPEKTRSLLEELIGVEKARATLVGQWGFAEDRDRGMGATAMLAGPPGTGKSMAAEAIAFELGRPVKRVNMAQIISKWAGEGSKNVELVFQSARQTNAVLVFDEADALFAARTNVTSSTDRYANLEVAVLLREMERFPGVVILTTNLKQNIDEAFIRRLRFVLELERPDPSAREQLWRKLLPKKLPQADDITLAALAQAFDLVGGQIRNAVLKAASKAALRHGNERVVCQLDLENAAQAELAAGNEKRPMGFVWAQGGK